MLVGVVAFQVLRVMDLESDRALAFSLLDISSKVLHLLSFLHEMYIDMSTQVSVSS